MALRRSHFQCGKCEGRRSQSSAARTPSLALPPRWARKEFCVVVCTALLTFVCMLRYWMWNVVPIWSLYSSIFMVIRCADPVSVFFDTYRNILYQSDISGQAAQSASIPRMFFPVGWKRQPEEGGVPQPHPPLKTSKTSPTASTPGAMPPSSGVPRPHPPNETSNVSPTASNAKSRRQKNLSHRHETPAFSFPGLPKKNKMYYTY